MQKLQINTRKTLLFVLASLLLFSMTAGLVVGKAKKEINEFPNAVREEPKVKISEKNSKRLNKAFDFVEEEQYEKARELLTQVQSDKRASAYEKALALTAQANIAWQEDNGKMAIELNQQAVDLNALDNKAQFNTLYQLAQMGLSEENYALALESITQWLQLSGKEDPAAYALKGNVYYRMDQFYKAAETLQKAIALSDKPENSWYQMLIASYYDAEELEKAAQVAEDVLVKDPMNKMVIQQLVSVYLNSEQEAKALVKLEAAYQNGLLTQDKDLKQLWQLYNFQEMPMKAAAVINSGLEKGILQPGLDVYRGLGDAYVVAENWDKAIESYSKAVPFAKNGDMNFQLAQLLIQESDRFQEGKKAITAALTIGGLKREGEAYILLGNAEYELGNKQAAIAAYKKASTYSTTKKMADSWLKSISQGG